MTEGGYQQTDREDWHRQVGLCKITITTPDGTMYEMGSCQITIERKTEYIEHRTLGGRMDEVIPIRSHIEMTAISYDVPDVSQEPDKRAAPDTFVFSSLPVVGRQPVRTIRFRKGRK